MGAPCPCGRLPDGPPLNPLPLALVAMYQVESYRGISEGWHPVGRPRPHAEAVALLHRVRQIRPDFVTRSRCLSPELFPVG
jgi:hypothetical protein